MEDISKWVEVHGGFVKFPQINKRGNFRYPPELPLIYTKPPDMKKKNSHLPP
jgi:hypothetical protein